MASISSQKKQQITRGPVFSLALGDPGQYHANHGRCHLWRRTSYRSVCGATRTTAFEDEVGGYSTVTLNGLEVILSHSYDGKDLENGFGCSLKVDVCTYPFEYATRTPNNGTPYPYDSHTTPIRLPKYYTGVPLVRSPWNHPRKTQEGFLVIRDSGTFLVGDFNTSKKSKNYQSTWIISPSRGKNQKLFETTT